MKTTTRVWAKLESVGKPEASLTLEGVTVGEAVLAFAKWMTQTYMGKYMRVTIARSQDELDAVLTSGASRNGSGGVELLMDELNGLLSQENLDLEIDPEPDMLRNGDDS